MCVCVSQINTCVDIGIILFKVANFTNSTLEINNYILYILYYLHKK